jgi:hypothetical protein
VDEIDSFQAASMRRQVRQASGSSFYENLSDTDEVNTVVEEDRAVWSFCDWIDKAL